MIKKENTFSASLKPISNPRQQVQGEKEQWTKRITEQVQELRKSPASSAITVPLTFSTIAQTFQEASDLGVGNIYGVGGDQWNYVSLPSQNSIKLNAVNSIGVSVTGSIGTLGFLNTTFTPTSDYTVDCYFAALYSTSGFPFVNDSSLNRLLSNIQVGSVAWDNSTGSYTWNTNSVQLYNIVRNFLVRSFDIPTQLPDFRDTNEFNRTDAITRNQQELILNNNGILLYNIFFLRTGTTAFGSDNYNHFISQFSGAAPSLGLNVTLSLFYSGQQAEYKAVP
jgi:hypothetical protein